MQTFMKKFNKHLLTISLIAFLSACNSSKKDADNKVAHNPSELYSEGNLAIKESKYKSAIKSFETIEREHPASPLAPEATVKKAYSFYLDDEFDDAIFTVEDFLKQYPSHHSVAYMYYLKALCYYDQIVDIGRDQQLTREALEALEEVVTRFPDSEYANDAKLKIDLAFNQLAGKEMNIGLSYLHKGNLIAALNRFKVVVSEYDTTIFVPEALYRMTEIYYSLGAIDQAKKYVSVLGYNYPNNKWYSKAYNLLESNINEPQPSITKRIISKIW